MTDISAARDVALMRRVAGGDTDALRALHDAHADDLVRLAFSYTRVRDLAEDVVQDVFVALWEKRAEIVVTGSVGGYLNRATRNRALNAVRDAVRAERREQASAREGAILYPVAENLGQRDAEAEELAAAVYDALAELPPRQREVFLLYREHGMDYETVADTLGITVPSARNLMSKAIQGLAARLARLR